jgi:hypothetical protein
MKCGIKIYKKTNMFLGYTIEFSHDKFYMKVTTHRIKYWFLCKSTKVINSLTLSEAKPKQIRHFVKLLQLAERFYV